MFSMPALFEGHSIGWRRNRELSIPERGMASLNTASLALVAGAMVAHSLSLGGGRSHPLDGQLQDPPFLP